MHIIVTHAPYAQSPSHTLTHSRHSAHSKFIRMPLKTICVGANSLLFTNHEPGCACARPYQVRVRLDLSAPSRRGELSFAVNGGEPVLALPLQRRALVSLHPKGAPHGYPLRAMSPTSASRDRA